MHKCNNISGKVVDSGGYQTKSFKPAYVKDKCLFDANIPCLGGEVDYMHADPPEFVEEPVEGGIPIKGAIVPIVLEYTSQNALT